MKTKKILLITALIAGAVYASDPEGIQTKAQDVLDDPLSFLDFLPFLSELIPNRKPKAKASKAAEKVKSKVDGKASKVAAKAGTAAEKVGAKVSTEVAEKVGAKVSTEVAEKVGAKVSTEVAEKVGAKVSTEVAEKVAAKVSTEIAEKVAAKTSTEVAEKAAAKVAADAAEKAAAKVAAEAAEKAAAKVAAEAAEKAAAKIATERASKLAERVAARASARIARAAVTAAKIAQLTARSAAADPVAMLDMLAMGVIITLQNTVKDLDPDGYKDPRGGMMSYSQLPEAVKAVFSMIPLIGTIGDFVFPFFEFGPGCPEGTSQEFPGSLCLPKCRDGYRGLWGDIFCYKDLGPEWEDSKEHSDWPIIPTTVKKIIRTNTGVPVSECGPNQDKDAGLCYDKCQEGYHGVGPVCWQDTQGVGIGTPVELEDCPAGFRTDPLTCQKDLHCTGGGCHTWECGRLRGAFGEDWGPRWCSGCDPVTCSGPETKGRLDNGGKCPSDREKIDGLCYKRCPDGWEHVPGAPYDCRKIGAPGMSIPRGVGKPMTCPANKTEDSAGLCYDAAPPGFRKSTLGLMETPCPSGTDDAGLLCTRHSYTRPGNVAFKFAIREHKGENEDY